MACSASIGLRRTNRLSGTLRASAKAGLCVSLLSLAVTLTPGLSGDAKAAIPPPHSANPTPSNPSNSLIEDCFRQAREAELNTPNWQYRVSSLLAIGRAQLVSGDAAGARATALDALRQIPADAGNPQDVGSNVGFTDGMPLKGVVAEAIELLAKSGDPTGALRASDRLHDGEDRAETLLTVADVYAASHNLPAAKIALNETYKSGFAIHDDSDRGETLSRLAAAWQRIDPQEIPPSLVSDSGVALRDAKDAWAWGRTPIKYVNRRWNPISAMSLPSRVVKSLARMKAVNDAIYVEQAFTAHGFRSTPTLDQEIMSVESGAEDNNSALSYPDLVPMRDVMLLERLHPTSLDDAVADVNLPANYTVLLAASQGGNSWQIATVATQISDRPWPTLSDPERKLIQQVRSDLIGRAGRSADGLDRAFLLCAAARLDLLVGDREDARGLIGQATGFFDAPVSGATTALQTMRATNSNRNQEVHGILLLRLADSLCALGDFSGAARLADEKGGSFRCECLQKIAYHAADARATRRSLIVAAQIETSYDAIMANQTLSNVTNILVRQHDWNDAHQAAMSIKDPSARVHALCLLIDGYYGRESAY